MFHIVHPKKDTTIYSYHPCVNVGLDEILELNVVPGPAVNSPACDVDYKTADNVPMVREYGVTYSNYYSHRSRIILYFELEQLIEYFRKYRERFILEYGEEKWLDLTTEENHDVYKCYLRLWSTESYDVPLMYDVEAYPLKPKWNYFLPYVYVESMAHGPGRAFNKPATNTGASWIYRDTDAGYKWEVPGAEGADDYNPEIDGKQHFDFENPDIFMDITDLFDYWAVEEEDNEGIILKRSDEDHGKLSELKFFGTHSHTVFVPELVFAYDDQYWYLDEESVDTIHAPSNQLVFNITEDLTIRVSNLLPKYHMDSVSRFRVNVDIKQAEKQFIEQKVYEDKFVGRMPNYIPRNIGAIQYSIIDKVAEKTVVPFSEFSKLSLDPDGYYFDVDLTNYFPERFYKIIFRYEDYIDGYSYVYDNNQTFKVVK